MLWKPKEDRALGRKEWLAEINATEEQKRIKTKQCFLYLVAQRSLLTLGDIGENLISQKTAYSEETEGESNSVKKLQGEGVALGVCRVEKMFLFLSYQT